MGYEKEEVRGRYAEESMSRVVRLGRFEVRLWALMTTGICCRMLLARARDAQVNRGVLVARRTMLESDGRVWSVCVVLLFGRFPR